LWDSIQITAEAKGTWAQGLSGRAPTPSSNLNTAKKNKKKKKTNFRYYSLLLVFLSQFAFGFQIFENHVGPGSFWNKGPYIFLPQIDYSTSKNIHGSSIFASNFHQDHHNNHFCLLVRD
jgi:hypothetical protein